ncbi:MAG: TonB-dependent receptor, partial [Myxococcota bacterium]
IRVVKGAAGARYGPDAIGGVLLVAPPPLRDTPGVEGKALFTGSLNGPGAYAAARVDAVPTGAELLSLRVEGNLRRAASTRTPDYVLGNTALFTWNAGAAIRYGTDATHIRTTYRHYDLDAGVFFGVRGAVEELGVDPSPAQIARWGENRFAIDRPRQRVSHDRATVHLRRTTSAGTRLEATYAFQLNRRREFESIQFAFEGPEFDFTLYTNSLDLLVTHPAWSLAGLPVTGGIGAQGMVQLNLYEGSTLLPNYRAYQAGLFAFERLEPSPSLAIELGWRLDWLSRTALLAGIDVARQEAEGNLDDDSIAEMCRQGEIRLRCPDAWRAASVSLGGVWEGLDERLSVKLDLSSASRFPSADEQYLIGSAPTFPVWAIGDLSLGIETTLQAQTTLGLRLEAFETEISGYASRSPNFIYFAPDRADPLRTTLVGVVPQFRYSPIRASFLGADGAMTVGPQSPVALRLAGAVVRAVDLDTQEFLVGVPPNRGSATLIVKPPARFQPELSLTVEGVTRRSAPPLDADLLPPPPGYVLLSASAEIEVPLGRRTMTVALDGFNLLDARFREYASLLRYYADFPGRDVRLRVGVSL